MYEDFYHLKRNPFRLTPDPAFRFEHPSYRLALYAAEEAIGRGEGFVVVTGASGTGKTTLAEELTLRVTDAGRDVCRVTSTQVEADDLLRLVAFGFGIDAARGSKASVQAELEKYLVKRHHSGLTALAIIDEAQDLTPRALEELRLLSNLQSNYESLLQIMLVGQERLRYTLQRPETETIQQRVVAMCELKALEPAQVRGYIAHRLVRAGWRGDPRLSGDAIRHIHQFTHGVPRRINVVMSRLLMHGGVERYHTLDTADVCEVLEGMEQDNLGPVSSDEDSFGLRMPGLTAPLRPLDSRTVEEFAREGAISISTPSFAGNSGRLARGTQRRWALAKTNLARFGKLPSRAAAFAAGLVPNPRKISTAPLKIFATSIVQNTRNRLPTKASAGRADSMRSVWGTIGELGRQVRFLSAAVPSGQRRVLAGTAAVGVMVLATAIYSLVPRTETSGASAVLAGTVVDEASPLLITPAVVNSAVFEHSVIDDVSLVMQNATESQNDTHEAVEFVANLSKPGLDMAALPDTSALRPALPTATSAISVAQKPVDGPVGTPLLEDGARSATTQPSATPAQVMFAGSGMGGFFDDMAVEAAEIDRYSDLDVGVLPATASGIQKSSSVAERSAVSFLPFSQSFTAVKQGLLLEKNAPGVATARTDDTRATTGEYVPTRKVNANANTRTREVATAELLANGDKAMLENRLTLPSGNSANDFYSRALALDPGNAHALAGIAEILRVYHRMARERLDVSDTEAAQRFVDRGLRVEPTSRRLLALREEIILSNSPEKIAVNIPEKQTVLAVPIAPEPPPAPARAVFTRWLGNSNDSLSIIH